LAVLILAAVLAIGLGISVISVQQVKMLSETGYSVIAFYAAENGIERSLMATGTPPSIGTTTLTNGATYKVTVRLKSVSGCTADNYCVKSIGDYKKTQRALEIYY